ncbi:class I SAM-dependent methyltransferase [Jatrophihabitans fulvus]
MSSSEGKQWTHERVSALAGGLRGDELLTVLDIGPGVGTYAKLFADLPVHMTGLEVWEPYVTTYRLHDYYDEILLGDVRTAELPPADVVVLGDVVEHMTRAEGLAVWDRCAAVARRAVYLSIPIVHYPQHEIEGNPYEVHVEEDWSHAEVLATFAGVGEWWQGDVVGVYERLTG